VREQRVGLEHDTAFALARRQRAHVVAIQADHTPVGLEEAGDEPQQRSLPAATGTEADHQLAGLDVQRHLEHAGLRAGIAIRYRFERDGGCHNSLAAFM
jgi:hypothetical protein